MADETGTESQPIPPAEVELLAGTERRINRAMWALGAVGTLLCLLGGGWGWGAGFAIGAVLSALNFRWMKTGVQALADAAALSDASAAAEPARLPEKAEPSTEESSEQGIPATSPPPRPRGVWGRFVLRYALIGLVGYAIFKSSFVSLGAFFLGLFLFIAAILAEVAYEIYRALRGV
ncbi:MAG: ATP synthase subunit I [Terriglobia bacterium]